MNMNMLRYSNTDTHKMEKRQTDKCTHI